MTKETKIRVGVSIAGWVVAAIIQAFSFGYFFGSLKQEVKGLGQRLDRIEQQHKTEVKDELEKTLIVWSGRPSGRRGQQCDSGERSWGAYPVHRGDCALASNPDCAQEHCGSLHCATQRSAAVEIPGEPRHPAFSFSYQKPGSFASGKIPKKTAPMFMRVSQSPGAPGPARAGAAVVGEKS